MMLEKSHRELVQCGHEAPWLHHANYSLSIEPTPQSCCEEQGGGLGWKSQALP